MEINLNERLNSTAGKFSFENETLHIVPHCRSVLSIYLKAMESLPAQSYIKVDPFAFGRSLLCAKTATGEIISYDHDEHADDEDEDAHNTYEGMQRIKEDPSYKKIYVYFDHEEWEIPILK